MDQPKLERLLRLMKLLTANTTYNVDQLAERLQMSRRTIYRYIDTFREAGFVIKKAGDCIRLDKESPHIRDLSQPVDFPIQGRCIAFGFSGQSSLSRSRSSSSA